MWVGVSVDEGRYGCLVSLLLVFTVFTLLCGCFFLGFLKPTIQSKALLNFHYILRRLACQRESKNVYLGTLYVIYVPRFELLLMTSFLLLCFSLITSMVLLVGCLDDFTPLLPTTNHKRSTFQIFLQDHSRSTLLYSYSISF